MSMFGSRLRATRVGESGSPVMTIFTGPSSTMMTRAIWEGSAIDAKRFRTSTLSNRLRRPQPRRDGVDRRRVERHADAHVGEAAHLLVRRGRVALNLDRRDGFGLLRRRLKRGAFRHAAGRREEKPRDDDRPPTCSRST